MGTNENGQSTEISLERKLAFLRQPAAYPEGATAVRAVETHMSWVFLADGMAYKLKKPVRLPYLDFGSIEARRIDCEEEVRLNRRLAPGIYLGTVALTCEPGGALALAGDGPTTDWLVKMRRLPETGLLDHLIARGAVTDAQLRALASLLARFYAAAPAVHWGPGEYVRRLRHDLDALAVELIRPEYGLPAERVGAIIGAQRDFLQDEGDRFERRVRSGRVVEGHGDLRPEHICLEPEPVVIDCLEFNREFRLLDPFDELAYLALECERLGDAALGERILAHYAAASGDEPDPGIVAFHKAHRGCLRAELAVWHLHDGIADEAAKWRARGRAYIALAAEYAGALGGL